MTNPDSVHSPDADALRRQMTKLLEASIAKLPESFRVVFMLREVEGLSVEETTEALGITRETVKTRLARARRELQQELELEAPQRPAGNLYFRGKRLRCPHGARASNVYSEWAQAPRNQGAGSKADKSFGDAPTVVILLQFRRVNVSLDVTLQCKRSPEGNCPWVRAL